MIANAPKLRSLEHYLRVEVVDDGHRDWSVIRRHLARTGHDAHLIELTPTGPVSARQSIVAAFLCGRMVGHTCFRVEPVRAPHGAVTVVARLDSHAVEPPFVGTSVEHVLVSLADSRARTMGCKGLHRPSIPRSRAA
jgi:hypothetical protein